MIDIDFVAGFDSPSFFQNATEHFIKRSGLEQRFAIIQSTYLEGCPDMYFDEALWKRLVEFLGSMSPGGWVSVVDDFWNPEAKGLALADYISSWNQLPKDDRKPPPFVMVRDNGSLKFLMVTEYWKNVGGPYPYADSYTYSVFSNLDLSGDIRSFLSKSPEAAGWRIASEVLQPILGIHRP